MLRLLSLFEMYSFVTEVRSSLNYNTIQELSEIALHLSSDSEIRIHGVDRLRDSISSFVYSCLR